MFEVEVDPGLILEGTTTMPDGSQRLCCSPDGCPHLRDETTHRCGIYEKRPQACRDFPFRAIDTPGGRYIGLSFACTAVRQSCGPPVAKIDRDWSELGGDSPRPDLIAGHPAEWQVYLSIEEYLADQLCFPSGAFSGALAVSLAARHQLWPQLGKLELKWLSDDIETTCQRTLRGLIALMEADNQAERAQKVLIGQAQGGRYWSQIFPGWVEPKKGQARMEEDDPDYWDDVEPFFRHLLFRKFLWGAPSIHARVCLLPLLNEIIRFWSWQQALAIQRKPNREMRQAAIRELERRLTFHAHGWENFLVPLSLAFVQGVA